MTDSPSSNRPPATVDQPSAIALVAAFAAVYVIWGSTYYGIRVAIESLPGATMAGVRFTIAGIVLYAYCRLTGAARPTPLQWRNTLIVGGLLLFGANGCVVWAEHRVPSGLTALLVSVLPVWMVLIEWLRPGGVRPSRGIVFGVVLGFIGVAVLLGPEQLIAGKSVDVFGAAALLLAGFLWAFGSIYSRQASMPRSPLLSTSMQMLCGGGLLLAFGAAGGEWARLDASAMTLRSLLALGYLIVFGSWIGFSAYVWLLRVSTPARVSTYAYVNPIVALVIGWGLGNEALDSRALIAAGVIIAAVAFITAAGASRPRPAPVRPADAPAALEVVADESARPVR